MLKEFIPASRWLCITFSFVPLPHEATRGGCRRRPIFGASKIAREGFLRHIVRWAWSSSNRLIFAGIVKQLRYHFRQQEEAHQPWPDGMVPLRLNFPRGNAYVSWNQTIFQNGVSPHDLPVLQKVSSIEQFPAIYVCVFALVMLDESSPRRAI